jgi:hypothetical protein
MRVVLTVYLTVAQVFVAAIAVSPYPPESAEVLAAQLSSQLMEREKALWAALQRRDRAAWLTLLPQDYQQVDGDGTLANCEEAFDGFAKEPIEEFSIHYLRGTPLGPDAFVVTYSISRKGDRAAQSSPPTFTASSIWVKRNGTWLKIHYQETPTLQAAH